MGRQAILSGSLGLHDGGSLRENTSRVGRHVEQWILDDPVDERLHLRSTPKDFHYTLRTPGSYSTARIVPLSRPFRAPRMDCLYLIAAETGMRHMFRGRSLLSRVNTEALTWQEELI